MSDRLTSAGYVKRDAQTIKDEIVARLKQKQPDFFEQSADVQNMLIDTSIEGIMEYENLCAEMVNSYAPFYSNDFMFQQLASSLGLKMKNEYKSQVILEFSGEVGDYVPEGVSVGSFVTQSSAVIPTSKRIQVLALSDDANIVAAGTLTKINEVLKDSIKVTNPQPSYPYVPQETLTQLKERAQSLLRSPRISSKEYARSKLESIDGVNPRLVNFREVEYVKENISYKGIECVCGGGEPSEVARVLFDSFLETQRLLSNPSSNEAARTQTIPINYYGTVATIKYTTPKLISLGLRINISFQGSLLSANNVEAIIQDSLLNYINNKRVGEALNNFTIQTMIIDLLYASSVPRENIKVLTITPYINEVASQWDENGYLAAILFDCYLILDDLIVTIGG